MSINFEFWAKEYEKTYKKEKSSIKYKDDDGKIREEESPYFETISKILQKRGYLLKEEFLSICEWKTPRPKIRYAENPEEDIQEITKTVISKHLKIEEQIENLTQLKGVGVPVASAILTVIFPKNYCVLDYRAWRSLLWEISMPFSFGNYSDFSITLDKFRNYASIDSYFDYLEKIKKLAEENSMEPRKIEMALWMYDKNEGIFK